MVQVMSVCGLKITMLKLRGWSGLTNNYVKTERLEWAHKYYVKTERLERAHKQQDVRNMSIISKVDKSQSLSIKFDTNQLTSIGNR